MNFHIWLLLEEHVEQLTGWCNPIRAHSYACYHHSAVTALSLHSEGRAAQVNTCTHQQMHYAHYTHSTPSSLHLTCSTNMSTRRPAKFCLTAGLTRHYVAKKTDNLPPGMPACILTPIFSHSLSATDCL